MTSENNKVRLTAAQKRLHRIKAMLGNDGARDVTTELPRTEWVPSDYIETATEIEYAWSERKPA